MHFHQYAKFATERNLIFGSAAYQSCPWRTGAVITILHPPGPRSQGLPQ